MLAQTSGWVRFWERGPGLVKDFAGSPCPGSQWAWRGLRPGRFLRWGRASGVARSVVRVRRPVYLACARGPRSAGRTGPASRGRPRWRGSRVQSAGEPDRLPMTTISAAELHGPPPPASFRARSRTYRPLSGGRTRPWACARWSFRLFAQTCHSYPGDQQPVSCRPRPGSISLPSQRPTSRQSGRRVASSGLGESTRSGSGPSHHCAAGFAGPCGQVRRPKSGPRTSSAAPAATASRPAALTETGTGCQSGSGIRASICAATPAR